MAFWIIAVVSGKSGWSQSFYVCKDVTWLFIALSLSIGLGLPVCVPVWCLWTPGEWAQEPMHWRQALFQAPPAATVFFLLLSFVYLFKLCVLIHVCVWGFKHLCVGRDERRTLEPPPQATWLLPVMGWPLWTVKQIHFLPLNSQSVIQLPQRERQPNQYASPLQISSFKFLILNGYLFLHLSYSDL